jgi:GNAT superfamily N-acetyltransferase
LEKRIEKFIDLLCGGDMITIEKLDTNSRKQVKRFVDIPYRLYKGHPQWVPPLRIDVEEQLNRKKHPYYERSEADFFIAVRDGKDVGRIAALENKPYNEYHGVHQAQFYLFDSEDDDEIAKVLFETLFEWARSRGLNKVVGPKGFAALDGYGLLVEGFEHRQMMSMMNYNYSYYVRLVENMDFSKVVDFVSCYLSPDKFYLPERVHRIAERVQQRGKLNVKRFATKKELTEWAPKIGKAYNQAFVNNWEYYPLSEHDIDFVLKTILIVADPRLIKVITHKEDVVGFLFGFHDLSEALQRSRGRLLPFGIIDILLEKRRTKWISLNGVGILPEFQGIGGNALLYSEMEKTIHEYDFEHADLTQVAETAVQMRSDLVNIGGEPYKNHRVYGRDI